MAYEEPGVKVIQQLQLEAANIESATQALTLVGELYEVFEDEVHSSSYDALTGAGPQVFAWPGKKTTSVVDFAGVRKSIAEVDDQLNEFAEYPLTFKLRDPSSSQEFDIDELVDVSAISQTGFTLAESVSAAVARDSDTDASAAKSREFHVSDGGLINAGVVTGDRVRLTNGSFDVLGSVDVVFDDHVFYTPDGHDFTLDADNLAGVTSLVATVVDAAATIPASGRLLVGSGATAELVDYSSVAAVGDVHTFTLAAGTPTVFAHLTGESVEILIVDTVSVTDDDGDLVTNPGYLSAVAGGLTGKEDARVVLWVEEDFVVDGAAAGASNIVQVPNLSLNYTHVGRKLSVWSEDAGDGAVLALTVTVADAGGGQGTSVTADAGTPFLATQVGDFIEIGGEYARIAAFTSTTEITLATSVTAGAAQAAQIFGQVVRTILAVETNGDVTVDGANLNSGTALPVVLHRPVYRDLVTDTSNSDTLIRYSGSAVTSETGILHQVPWEVFDNDLTYELFPNFELLVTYRALDITSVDDELGVYSATDLAGLGGITPANPLVWAAQTALTAMGTDDTVVILMPVDLWPDDVIGSKSGYPEDTNEVTGYLNALDKLSMNESAYYMVPLTQNPTVRDAFVTHVGAMSAPEEKKERVCYLSYGLPLGDLESVTGTIEPGLEGGNKAILDPGQNFLSSYNVTPGDTIVVTTPAAYAGEYTVAAGSTEDRVELESNNWGQAAVNGTYDASVLEFEDTAADTSVAGEVTSAVNNQWKDVEAGDYLYHDGDGVTRKITAVSANGGVPYGKLTYEGLDLPTLAAAQTVSVIRSSVSVNFHLNPLTKDEQAAALAAIGTARGSRRVVHMWPDEVEMVTGSDSQGNDVREYVPSYFAAAAEAGRDAVIPVARSSTGAALAGFTGLRHSNFYFKKAQLNVIAAGGWSILEQRVSGAAVTMRHLLTTDMSSVKTQELAFTKNVDNMAKVKRASVEPLLNDDKGRINITTQFLTSLAVPFQGIYENFVKNEQLVQTNGTPPYKILSLVADTDLPDTILEEVELNVPLPANKVTTTFII